LVVLEVKGQEIPGTPLQILVQEVVEVALYKVVIMAPLALGPTVL
jgi:hypothetical protein